MTVSPGRYGVWRHATGLTPGLAREIESLGFGAVWIGGSPPGDLQLAEDLLDATGSLVVATGIVNMWTTPADEVAPSYHRIAAKHPDRFLLGVGIGHPEATGDYTRPYATIVEYLDRLDELAVPAAGRALAALGPKVLDLSRDRTAGAHPYLTTPEHTRSARERLGDDVLLAPEHKVVLDTDPGSARALGRPAVHRPYLGLRNYRANLLRLGWTEAELDDGGSDALIDALVAHGTPEQVAARLDEHLAAGADHVCAQLITPGMTAPEPGLRRLASALGIG
ncbi:MULTISPECIES: LLM class F420-dependent oxidoreductase [Pseudonocardia]|uniref:Luciferase-like monooxygenase n=2 Tax=Pseudonocardia TaxID=1847 RepID=A0A1Y2N4U6_PSEAH|nr:MULTISPECIES: LLM class F420-dependent oxidoreductase [Pseudonocardia]OSY42500.1 Luciferase-like monooxygenase [Pseudonocardia autotrophica]TDN76019.1 putative F420-dependent oxidoreductase [Pseudonocardia autotrophica]BBF99995.1 LLM class F420-dependent oxidoreductase [Pseudonocardia autotrophica]GEC25055.1 LLM class F420-dependent oxidoreductase [Pseudonocardia saturnea]